MAPGGSATVASMVLVTAAADRSPKANVWTSFRVLDLNDFSTRSSMSGGLREPRSDAQDRESYRLVSKCQRIANPETTIVARTNHGGRCLPHSQFGRAGTESPRGDCGQ